MDHNKLEIFFPLEKGMIWEYQIILPASWETCMQVKKQQLKAGIGRWTGSKLGKEYVKAYIIILLI